MKINKNNRNINQRRKNRVRAKICGTPQKPRLSVFRSLKHIYAQIIDDSKGITLASVSDLDFQKDKKIAKKPLALEIGKLIASKAKDKKITEVIFDRGGYKYHGKVKELADGAREGGLKF